jgi:predicted MPP superfamily phosphohydrolase
VARRLLVASTAWLLLHLYVGVRLLAHAPIAVGWRALGWVGVLLLALAPFAAFVTGRTARTSPRSALPGVAFVAMGLSSLLIVFAVAADLLQMGAWLGPGTISLAIVGGALVVLILGAWRARRPAVVRVAVPIANLPPDLEGFRIVQLSDLHIGATLRRAFVERVVAAANGLAPDLIALTGDVADGLPPVLRDEVAPLGRLAAPHGKFFVTGNHEYYWDAPAWVRELERLGFSALVNAHRVIRRGAARLVLAGVTDHAASRRVPGHASDPAAAIAGAPAADVRVLLAHQPKSAFAAHAVGFDLQLSGHTHGGQYFPFSLLVRLFQPFVAGLHRLEAMWLYVSRGTGYWGPPLRLGAPSEITLIQLTRA